MNRQTTWNFIAVDACIGRGAPVPATAGDLARRLTELPVIGGAMVRLADIPVVSPEAGNRWLAEDLQAASPQLAPVWFVMPGGETAALAAMAQAGAWLTWSRPREAGFDLTRWCAGKLLEALSERKLPLLLSANDVTWDELHRCLEEFPQLRVIVSDLPRLGRQVRHEQMLELHPNLYLVFSPTFSVHGGPGALVARFGMERFLWGMNYPVSEPGAALTGILYSDVSDAAVAAIASENLLRLRREAGHG